MQKDFSLPKHIFLVIFVVFIFWNLLSFYRSGYLYESIRGLLKVIKYGFVLIISLETFRSKDFAKKVFYFLILWSLVIALNGIIEGRLGFDLIRLKAVNSLDYLLRISSSFHQSNDFGAYLVFIIPIFLSFIFSKKINWPNRAYFLCSFTILFYCLMRTYSRGAWLSLFIATLILSLLKSKKLLVGIIILMVILSFFSSHNVKERIFNLFNFEEGTSWERLKLWKGAMAMIKEHPFLGFGVNTYTKNFPKYKPNDYPDSIYPHNCYLQMATEIGLVGLGLFLMFNVFLFMHIAKNLKLLSPGWIKNAVIGLFAGLIGFLIHSTVDTHLYSVNLAVMFYFLLGLCVALCDYGKDNPA